MSNSPLSNDERRSRFELRTLLETSRLLIESQDPDFVLNNLLLITMGKLLVPKGMILIHKPGDASYLVSKSKGRNWLAEGSELSAEFDQKLLDTSVIHGEKYAAVFDAIGIERESALFNLKTSNHHLGFLCLGPKGNKTAITDHEIEFIESLSIISSVAIANSRMFKELRHINRRLDRKVHDLNTLLELSKDFNMMVDRDEIARVFKFAMLGQMLIRTFFFALDIDGKRSIISISGIKEPPSNKDLDELFALDDIARTDDIKNCAFLAENNIELLIGLRFQNEKIGVVGVGPRATMEGYGDAEINFLQSLGNLALLTIQKTLLLEEQIVKKRLEEELNLAKTIQEGLLPSPIPKIPGMEIAAVNVSSRQVGGDYFDVLKLNDNGHLLAIADVTGKGIPASLLMANLQSMLHALAPLDVTLEEATGRINDIIYENTPPDKFITFFWGKITEDGKTFKYTNAGHNPPMVFKKDSDEPILLEDGGVILGAVPTFVPYSSAEYSIESGDLIVFFTDGVTEAMNPDQTEEYEEHRLVECVNAHRNLSADGIMKAIIRDINQFANNIQYDDITMIILKVN
ncbi:MAG: PP2C family protein-serine/threonine phosphatase [bacterium]|nr:PP2C family protein-serine/threonine phosphatase [bacterium]